MTEKQVTLSKHQYRQACNAYINLSNLQEQILLISPVQDDRSPDALYALQTTLQKVQQQLKEAINW